MWVKDYNWQALIEKKLPAPYKPSQQEDNFDSKQANGRDIWKEENADLLRQNSLLLRRNSIQNLFKGYYYDLDLVALQRLQEQKESKKKGNVEDEKPLLSLRPVKKQN